MVVIPESKTSCLWRHTLQLWRSLIEAGAVGEDPLDRRVPESALLTWVILRSSLDCRLLFDLSLARNLRQGAFEQWSSGHVRPALAGVAAGTGIAVLAVNVLTWLWGV